MEASFASRVSTTRHATAVARTWNSRRSMGPAARSASYTQMVQPKQQSTWGPAARSASYKRCSQETMCNGTKTAGQGGGPSSLEPYVVEKEIARKPSSTTTYVPFAGKRLIFSCRSRVVQKGTASAQQTPRRPCSKHGNLLPVLATQSLQEKDMSCIQARP